MKVFRNLFGNGSKIHADEIITGTPENHKTVKQSLDETAAHLAEIVHETIYLSEYKTNDYNMIFADITSRANANDFTTIVLDSRLVTLTIDLIFTKPVYVKGNKCRFATGGSSHYFIFAEGSNLENFDTDGISVSCHARNIKIDNVNPSNVSNDGNVIFRSGITFLIKNNEVFGNLNVKNCTSLNNHGHGFAIRDIDASAAAASLIENVTFENCIANNNGKEPNDWFCGFDIIDYAIKVKNFTFINCIANNNEETGFHAEEWVKTENIVFINCSAEGNGMTTFKPKPQYGSGFMNFKEFTFINCTSKGNKRPFVALPGSEGDANLIVFGTHINSNSGGEKFDYPYKSHNDINNWIDTNCALGVGTLVYLGSSTGYAPAVQIGGIAGHDAFTFIKEADGKKTVSVKEPYLKGTLSIITTPPIPIDSKDGYIVEFYAKRDEIIESRDRLMFYVSTLDKNFKKNNGEIGYYSPISPQTPGVYSLSSFKIGALGTDSVLPIPSDTKYIVISLEVANMDISNDGLAIGQPVGIQHFSVKDLTIRRINAQYLNSPDGSVYRMDIGNDGAISATKL